MVGCNTSEHFSLCFSAGLVQMSVDGRGRARADCPLVNDHGWRRSFRQLKKVDEKCLKGLTKILDGPLIQRSTCGKH